MIDRQGNEIIFECDTCGDTRKSEPHDDFATAWNECKRDGWRTKKIGSDWVHGCRRCGVE